MTAPFSATGVPSSGGVLLVDKPEGPTSHDVVDRVRRLLGERRVGHTGTLDPFASGLLVLCVGRATRLSEYLAGLDKEYLAVVRLGRTTATQDPDGELLTEHELPASLGAEDVEAALAPRRGRIRQVPPVFSAKKVGGQRAYRKARRGEPVELKAVEVTVHALELLALEPPFARLRVHCSSGTYVRALARDIGESLGVGAHLAALRRTRVGPFRVEDAVRLDEDLPPETPPGAWVDPARALAHLPSVRVEGEVAGRLAGGQTIPLEARDLPLGEPVAVIEGERLVAVAIRDGDRLRPRKVFAEGGAK